jgi:peptidoglycan/LPS O-acetylase OafA/YrhL
MGRISFSFYLVHGPVLWILGDRLYTATGWGREANALGIPHWINAFPLSKQGPLGLEMSFLVPHLILLPVTLWLAEIVTRFIDEPSVKFSQWLYNRTMGPQEDQALRLK